ncbi:sigma-70 family RNA polymerase sigma factor [Streptomyces morookaense]|uniref:BACON domain-containing protein n=1 Tax=Streptomyces morookaense TaxID=1970 RepID=UPI003405A2C7
MTSRPEPPTHATGALRASRRAPRAAQPTVVAAPDRAAEPDGLPRRSLPGDGRRTAPGEPPARHEPYLDGLFTYCLSVLCDHDAATAALGEVLALAERRADRAPADEELQRAWLYALARWECLRRLAGPGPGRGPDGTTDPRRRAELALLAWPEAAGTTAEQREALELAVRHRLSPHEVAVVLRLDPDAARTLLSTAACEVERTRTALAVVESGRCPVVSRFAESAQVLLGAPLRRELVRHVDECADCRRTAERATAGEPWPGTAASSATLPVLEAPRTAAHDAMLHALDPRLQRQRVTPRFDRGGFPLAPKDRAARRSRLRSGAVTTTVVATVVAAPVLALWAACRGEEQGTASVSATETDSLGGHPYEQEQEPYEDASSRDTVGHRISDLSVAVSGPDSRTTARGPGRLTVEAQPSGGATLITLTASGGEPVSWSMSASAPWLRLSQPGGVLRPGQSITVTVTVDHTREPSGHWRARVAIAPGRSTVTIEGGGAS